MICRVVGGVILWGFR